MHTIVEARGPRVEVVVTPGQTSDYGPPEVLTEGRTGNVVIADRGYDADRVVDPISGKAPRP